MFFSSSYPLICKLLWINTWSSDSMGSAKRVCHLLFGFHIAMSVTMLLVCPLLETPLQSELETNGQSASYIRHKD